LTLLETAAELDAAAEPDLCLGVDRDVEDGRLVADVDGDERLGGAG
jgi:hypothetical protein